jgi:ribonuclease P protein component
MKRRGGIRGSCFELRHTNTGATQARLGLVIGKRYARQAVLRNLIKRQGREVFRHLADRLPAEDFVLRLVKPMQALPGSLAEQRQWVRVEIDSLFQRVQLASISA